MSTNLARKFKKLSGGALLVFASALPVQKEKQMLGRTF